MGTYSNYIDHFRQLDLAFFPLDNPEVIFCPDTLQIFSARGRAGALLQELRCTPAVEAFLHQHAGDLPAICGLIKRIIDSVGPESPALPQAFPEIAHGEHLPKLVLIVNNYCNLKCVYCYEHDTMFRWPAHSMTPELAEFTVEKFYTTFGSLGKLMFIGGEPTLNTGVIEAACARALTLAETLNVAPPAFSMISNGYKLDDSTLALLDRYRIQTTFSIDGPKKVNDLVRISGSGEGSYDRIASNIRRFRAKVNAVPGVECTITKVHQDTGITIGDLLGFVAEEIGVQAPHIAPAGVPAHSSLYPYGGDRQALLREYREAAAISVDNALARVTGSNDRACPALDSVMSMLSTLIKRKGTNGMCPAGTTQLSVDCHGDVYPCWMFAGVAEYRMGNVRADDIFNEMAVSVLKKIALNTKQANAQCSKCFARYLCNACVGNNHNTTGRFDQMDEGFCDVVRATAETVIVKTAQLHDDPERWERLRGLAKSVRHSKAEACL